MEEDRNEGETRYSRRTGKILMLSLFGVLLLGGLIAGIAVLLHGGHHEEASGGPASISNAPSQSADDQSGSASVSPSSGDAQESSSSSPSASEAPSFDTGPLKARLSECMNKATDPSDITDVTNDCFYSYRYHMGGIYAMRNLGPVSVSNVKIEDASTKKVDATIVSDGHDIGGVEAYWIPDLNQFKVVGIGYSDYANDRINNTIVDEVENQR